MPQIVAIASDDTIPERVDVAIIGGGIAGVTTALELAERGVSVALFEKGVVAGEQSGRNWGWVRQMGRDGRELPLIKISMDLWRGMDKRLGAETGFQQCGIAYLSDTDAGLAGRRQWYEEQAVPHGLSTHMLSAREASAIVPDSPVGWRGGTLTPDDARAEPQLAVPAMALAARALGAKFFQNCAVRGVETSAGKISAVVTENGSVQCGTVVLAGGAWSRRFLHNLGIRLPQLSVSNPVMRTAPFDARIAHSFTGGGVAIRKRLDGGYTIADEHVSTADIIPDSFRFLRDFLPTLKTDWRDFRYRLGTRFIDEAKLARRWELDQVSPFEQVRVLDPVPDPRIIKSALKSLHQTLPEFRDVTIVEQWAGIIDVMPDVVPVISPVKSLSGFFMSTGFSGHGFGLGPGAGKLMAELITGETPCVDPGPFRFERFL